MRALPLVVLALLAGCFSDRACPTDRPLARDDLPCECGGASLESLPYCGSYTCDPTVGGVYDACDQADGGDSGGDSGASGDGEDPAAAG